MKKILFAVLIAVSLTTSAFAADTKVNPLVLVSFENLFNKAKDVTWTSTADYFKATFVLNNEKMEAFYKPDGEFIGATKAISIDNLPAKAKAAFTARYSGYNVKEAIRFEGEDETAYFISLSNEKESLIVKVLDNHLSIFKRTQK